MRAIAFAFAVCSVSPMCCRNDSRVGRMYSPAQTAVWTTYVCSGCSETCGGAVRWGGVRQGRRQVGRGGAGGERGGSRRGAVGGEGEGNAVRRGRRR